MCLNVCVCVISRRFNVCTFKACEYVYIHPHTFKHSTDLQGLGVILCVCMCVCVCVCVCFCVCVCVGVCVFMCMSVCVCLCVCVCVCVYICMRVCVFVIFIRTRIHTSTLQTLIHTSTLQTLTHTFISQSTASGFDCVDQVKFSKVRSVVFFYNQLNSELNFLRIFPDIGLQSM